MQDDSRNRDLKDYAIAALDPRRGLWRMVIAPLIAAVYFTVSYMATSVYCIRTGASHLGVLADVLGWFTVATLALILFCIWVAWRRLRLVRRAPDAGQRGRDRLAFLARVTLYLASLSGVGVLFLAAPLAFVGNCA